MEPSVTSFPAPASTAADAASGSLVDRLLGQGQLTHTRPSAARAIRVTLLWLAIWWAPVLAVVALFGRHSVMVTFGGAYAVLAYIAQEAVGTFHWITPGQMLDGLALAETTPGPLIMVVQFVDFLGAYYRQSGMSALGAGIAGSVLTTWVTFAPCFLWILLGAPYIEALRSNRALHAALSAVTAAVVGVVLNLSVWFTLHTVFARVDERLWGWAHLEVPAWSTLQWSSAVIAAAMLAMLRFKAGMGLVLLVSGLASIAMAWGGIIARALGYMRPCVDCALQCMNGLFMIEDSMKWIPAFAGMTSTSRSRLPMRFGTRPKFAPKSPSQETRLQGSWRNVVDSRSHNLNPHLRFENGRSFWGSGDAAVRDLSPQTPAIPDQRL